LRTWTTRLLKTWNCENNCSEYLGQYIQNISKGMKIENRVSPGRPRKWSKRDERKLVITSKMNPFLTAKELAEYMRNAENVFAMWIFIGNWNFFTYYTSSCEYHYYRLWIFIIIVLFFHFNRYTFPVHVFKIITYINKSKKTENINTYNTYK